MKTLISCLLVLFVASAGALFAQDLEPDMVVPGSEAAVETPATNTAGEALVPVEKDQIEAQAEELGQLGPDIVQTANLCRASCWWEFSVCGGECTPGDNACLQQCASERISCLQGCF